MPSDREEALPLDAEDSPEEAAPSDPAATPSVSPPLPPSLHGRLHPMTLVFGIFGGWAELRSAFFQLLPAGVVLYTTNRTLFFGLLILLLLYPPFHAALLYFTFHYDIEEGELATRHGVLKRTERHVPLERVQDLRIEQNLLHQFFGVVVVFVETAGGTGPEAKLSVISRAEAERLRQAIFERFPRATREAAEAEPDSGRQLIRRLDVREILLTGLTSNRSASFLVFLLAGWTFLDDVLPDAVYDRLMRGITDEYRFLSQQGAQFAALVFFLFVLVMLIFSVLLSVQGALFLFYGFTLSRDGEDLHRLYGLLTRRSSSLPRRRIQVLEIEEGLLRRCFKLATLRADVAGGVAGPNSAQTGRDVLLPILRRGEVESLLPIFFPDLDADPPDWRRVSKRAIRRGTLSGSIPCVLLTLGTVWMQRGWPGLWPLLFLPLIYGLNVIGYRRMGYALGEGFFRTRRGWSGNSTHIVPIRNIQSVALTQTFFDRRMGLASLVLDTAGQAFTGGGPRVENLPVEEAIALAQTLAKRASESRYQWKSRK